MNIVQAVIIVSFEQLIDAARAAAIDQAFHDYEQDMQRRVGQCEAAGRLQAMVDAHEAAERN
jgi:hypothetical protein